MSYRTVHRRLKEAKILWGKDVRRKSTKGRSQTERQRGIRDAMCILWSAHTTIPKLLNGQAIELVYLLTNASRMNDVERVFADIEKNVLANSNSPTTEYLQELKLLRGGISKDLLFMSRYS